MTRRPLLAAFVALVVAAACSSDADSDRDHAREERTTTSTPTGGLATTTVPESGAAVLDLPALDAATAEASVPAGAPETCAAAVGTVPVVRRADPEGIVIGHVDDASGELTACLFVERSGAWDECALSVARYDPAANQPTGMGGGLGWCDDVALLWVLLPEGTAWVAQDRGDDFVVSPVPDGARVVPVSGPVPGGPASGMTASLVFVAADGTEIARETVTGAVAS
ncbi:MAG: hypothetical protein SGJ13_02275 [Actinomycetota bacterium]|nr:hypothetical protein [Actinomycetota bacterium]